MGVGGRAAVPLGAGTVERVRWLGMKSLAVAKLAVAVLVAAAALAAVAAVPLLAAGGVADVAAERVEEIEPLVEPPLAQRSTLLAADGSFLAHVYSQNRVAVPFAQIPASVVDAVIATEDARFYEHRGVDPVGIVRALRANSEAGAVSQGASTITQQYVKNVLALAAGDDAEKAAAATEQTLSRKLTEAHHALELETRLSKDEILERYLNLAYFGEGAWGVEAAARTYFGVGIAEVSLSQAAVLAGVLKAPSRLNPIADVAAATERRDVVLARMVDAGYLTDTEAAAAAAEPVVVTNTPPSNGCAESPYPFYCDWAVDELENEPALGATAAQRRTRLLSGGLTIRTGLDPATQAVAQAAVDRIPRTDRVAAASVTVTPGTGVVTSMAVNRNYGIDAGETVVALATVPAHPGASLFKTFTLTAAIEAGVELSDTLPGGDRHTSTVFDNPASGAFTNSDGGGRTDVTVADATARSQNTAFVQLLERVGVAHAADVAARLGITSLGGPDDRVVSDREGSFTLGAREVSVLDMANAYATLAAGGVRCAPRVAVEVSDPAGSVTVPDRCRRSVERAVADQVSAALSLVVSEGTGRAARIGRPVAGKTGTADDFGAAWFAGYTPQVAAAVWVGDPLGPSHPLLNVAGVARVYGGTIPAEMFAALMGPIHAPLPVVDFSVPAVPAGSPSPVPDLVGVDAEVAASRLDAAGFAVERVPVDAPGLPAGVVVATTPAAGVAPPAGSTVRLDVAR